MARNNETAKTAVARGNSTDRVVWQALVNATIDKGRDTHYVGRMDSLAGVLSMCLGYSKHFWTTAAFDERAAINDKHR